MLAMAMMKDAAGVMAVTSSLFGMLECHYDV